MVDAPQSHRYSQRQWATGRKVWQGTVTPSRRRTPGSIPGSPTTILHHMAKPIDPLDQSAPYDMAETPAGPVPHRVLGFIPAQLHRFSCPRCRRFFHTATALRRSVAGALASSEVNLLSPQRRRTYSVANSLTEYFSSIQPPIIRHSRSGRSACL